MGDVSRMQGTPWHAERVHRAEGDDRRYRGRCKHFNYESEECRYRFGKCIGSSHCDSYEAISEEEFKAKQAKIQAKKRNKKPGEDDCFWY